MQQLLEQYRNFVSRNRIFQEFNKAYIDMQQVVEEYRREGNIGKLVKLPLLWGKKPSPCIRHNCCMFKVSWRSVYINLLKLFTLNNLLNSVRVSVADQCILVTVKSSIRCYIIIINVMIYTGHEIIINIAEYLWLWWGGHRNLVKSSGKWLARRLGSIWEYNI